ncbi:hypothetical protein OS493_007940 [Desmophyllum pertusum]|uniref:Receptor ligand binding region domain-containing protein n=1 Tax=Desmophyllum pertusum TaxID=174260 RepID=A0A9W9YHZ4_9CNID|nr:hypothetical protein OS493_007940 [Desmophyllum pertusum]
MYIYFALIIIASFVQRVYTTSRIFTCGFVNGYSAEYDVVNSIVNNASNLSLVVLKEFNITETKDLFNLASAFRDQNVITLIEGSHTKTSACALSTVTGIPLIRLHGDSRPFDQCEKAIQMSAGYRDYAHATLDILNTFGWKNIIVVFDESRVHEAGHFHAISRSSELIMHFVQLSKQGENEDATAPIVKAFEQMQQFEAEIILLYIEKKNVELMLQQKRCQHRIIYKWVLQGQMPLKLSSYKNVVISLDISYTHNNSASDKIKNAFGSNYSNTNKEQLALAYDAVQVINQAVNKEPCFSINGSVITPEDTDAMLTCMRKVNTNIF